MCRYQLFKNFPQKHLELKFIFDEQRIRPINTKFENMNLTWNYRLYLLCIKFQFFIPFL